MGVLIDSNALIAAERGLLNVAAKVEGRKDDEFFISVVTASELLHGVWRAKDAKMRAQRAAFVEGILERFPVLPIELAVARTHAQLWAELEAKGSPIGAHDLWLAASCVALGHALITRNVREFKRVPGLRVEEW
ncbi:MAG: type II toxin-antitoxin system VapC family toxin [Elusimicrobia bacterium]|nr:type II toxin-antitoxin system VapC family toxin [Elusimicrobiota bacterium]